MAVRCWQQLHLIQIREATKLILSKLVKVIDTVEPDAELAAKYEARYQQFKEIYPACKPLFEIIK